jgi:hypothetical protein
VVVAARILPASAWSAAVVRVLQIRVRRGGSVGVVGGIERRWVRKLQMSERATCEGEDEEPS